tara:strand:- start:157 stop:348 length:192 start_codon:yes stop_codon:yes gene_type:complete
MVKDGEILDISQYRKTREGSNVPPPSPLVEDWEREAIDQLISESKSFTALENRIKVLEEERRN